MAKTCSIVFSKVVLSVSIYAIFPQDVVMGTTFLQNPALAVRGITDKTNYFFIIYMF